MGLLNKRQKHLKRAREQKLQKAQHRAMVFAEIDRKRQRRQNRRARELEREESRLAAEQLHLEASGGRGTASQSDNSDELKDSVLEARKLWPYYRPRCERRLRVKERLLTEGKSRVF
jgi:hypothetical protein